MYMLVVWLETLETTLLSPPMPNARVVNTIMSLVRRNPLLPSCRADMLGLVPLLAGHRDIFSSIRCGGGPLGSTASNADRHSVPDVSQRAYVYIVGESPGLGNLHRTRGPCDRSFCDRYSAVVFFFFGLQKPVFDVIWVTVLCCVVLCVFCLQERPFRHSWLTVSQLHLGTHRWQYRTTWPRLCLGALLRSSHPSW